MVISYISFTCTADFESGPFELTGKGSRGKERVDDGLKGCELE